MEALYIALTDVQDFGLEALTASTSLRKLAFGGARVSETALQSLRQLPGLVKLDINAPTQAISFNGGINLSESSMDAIASLNVARDLRLGYNRFPARLLQGLTRLEHVDRLGLE